MQQKDMEVLPFHTFLHIRGHTMWVIMEIWTLHGSSHIKDGENVVIVFVSDSSFHALVIEFGDWTQNSSPSIPAIDVVTDALY